MTHTPDPPAKPGSARRRNASRTRDRLVRAALDLFSVRGYHETRTPDIARRAGVAEGTIYRHFETKEHLLNELFRAGVRVFLRAMEGAAEGSCESRLQRVGAAWRRVAADDPALCRLVFGRRFAPLLDERSVQQARTLREAVTRIVTLGKAEGTVRPGAADTWAEVWMAVTALGLERIADGSWRAEDGRPGLTGEAAWDAIRQTGALQGPPAA